MDAPRRERLAEALACVVGCDPALLRRDASSLTAAKTVVLRIAEGRRDPESITDPREAWEALTTALDLAGWVDDPRRRFAAPPGPVPCPTCGGDGLGSSRGFDDEPDPCHACGGSGTAWSSARTAPHPPDVAAGVAFAADAPGVLAAEAIAREVTRCERVVWRAAPVAEVERTRGVLRSAAAALVSSPRQEGRWSSGAATDMLATGYVHAGADGDTITLLCPALGAGE